MNRFFIIIILGLVLGSCSANWHIRKAEQKCPECFSSNTRIEYKDTIIKIDTSINIVFTDSLRIDTFPVIRYEKEYINKLVKILPTFDTIIKVNNGLTAKFWMNKGLFGSEIKIDSNYIWQLEDSIHILNKTIEKTNTVKIEKQATFKTYLVLFIITLSIILLIKIIPFKSKK